MTLLKFKEFDDGRDVECELVETPSTNEMRAFRLAAGIPIPEWQELLAANSMEIGAMVAFASLRRAGKAGDDEAATATALLDLPIDVLGAILKAASLESVEAEEDEHLPPTSGSASSASGNSGDEPSGPSSPESLALPERIP